MNKNNIIILIVAVVAIVAVVGVFLGTSGITGGTIIKSVSCYDSTDCDDHRAETEDFCKSPGTEHSLCVNKPLE